MVIRVAEWRSRRKLSYRELAKRADISLSTLQRVEAGQVSPTLAVLERLAGALGIGVHDLLPPRTKRTRRTTR